VHSVSSFDKMPFLVAPVTQMGVNGGLNHTLTRWKPGALN